MMTSGLHAGHWRSVGSSRPHGTVCAGAAYYRAHGRGLGNLATCGIDQLAAIVRSRLKSIQYRPGLIDAFITETGLAVEVQPP